MKRLFTLSIVVFFGFVIGALYVGTQLRVSSGGPQPVQTVPGDVNGDDRVNIADVSYLANFLFGIPPATPPVALGTQPEVLERLAELEAAVAELQSQGTPTLSEVSSGLLTEGFRIRDSIQVGPFTGNLAVTFALSLPDVGIAESLSVSVDIQNSDISNLELELTDPSGIQYVLYDGGGSGNRLEATFPATPLVSGDLSTWIGRNPRGQWLLVVTDSNGSGGDGWRIVDCSLAADVQSDEVEISSPTVPTPIPDNNPIGVTDTITVADLGVVESVSVAIEIENSSIDGLVVELTDPDGVVHLLHKLSGSGTDLVATYPETPLVSGDLSTWAGRNPLGDWTLRVIDLAFLNNGFDGQIADWSVIFESSHRVVDATGELVVSGGDLEISDPGSGLILSDSFGINCYRVTVDFSGTLLTTSVPCP